MDSLPPNHRPDTQEASALTQKNKKKKKTAEPSVGAEFLGHPLTAREKKKIDRLLTLEANETTSTSRLKSKKELRARTSVSLTTSDAHYKSMLRLSLEDFKKNGKTPEACYIIATSYYGLGKLDEASEFIDLLVEITPQSHPLYASTLLQRSKIQLVKLSRFNEQILNGFALAHKLGHPDACKYLVAARAGLMNGPSLIKWCNPHETIRVLESFPDLTRQLEAKVVNYKRSTEHLPDDHLHKLACLQMQSTEGLNMSDVVPFGITLYSGALCDLFISEKSSDAKRFLEGYIKAIGSQSTSAVLFLYVQFLRSSKPAERKALIEAIEKNPQPSAHLFSAKALEQLDEKKYYSAIIKHLEQPYCLETLQGYEELTEFYIKNRKTDKALAIMETAAQHLTDFLAGNKSLYGHRLGGQIERMKQDSIAWEQWEKDALEFEELQAAHNHLKQWEVKADFYQEVFKEPPAPDPIPAAEKAAKEKQSPSLQTDLKESEKAISKPEAQEESATVSPITEVPDVISKEPSPSPSVKAKPKIHEQSQEFIHSTINRAMGLIRLQAEFEEAESLLLKLNPQPRSTLWFRQQQALCWLKLEKATHYDYLSGQLKPGEEPAQKSKDMLKSVDKRARSLLHMIEAEVCKSIPESQQPVSHDSFSKTIEQALIYKTWMGQQDQQGLSRQYSSLYSTLGHIQKAFRDNPKCHGEHYLQDGLQYYRIANRLRDRRSDRL